MTNLSAGNDFSLNMDQFDVQGLLTGTNGSETSSSFKVDVGGGYVETYSGVGLTYDSQGQLATGTLTGLSEAYFGATTFSMSSFSIDAASWSQWVHAGNTGAALDALFGGNDTIAGGGGADVLNGMTGHDYISGGAGADTITGGDGNDHIFGQSVNGGADGADSLSGGDGSDYLQGNAGNDTIDGGTGSDRINGGANDDLITGGVGNDTVNGNLGNDSIDGGDGNDFLRGGKGDDLVSGGSGNDILSGDLGNDTLVGGSGADTLTGADGTDLFKFGAGDASWANSGPTDRITDFTHGTDHIALDFAPAAVLTAASQTSLSAAAATAQQLFDGHAGDAEVAALQVGGDTYLFYGSGGGAHVDSAIMLQAASSSTIGASDFV